MNLDADVKEVLDQEGELYTAAVSYVVAEKSDENAWMTISKWATRMQSEGKTLDEVMAAFSQCEEKIKHDYNITSMPSKWRSAKANVRNAWIAGIPFDQPKSKVDAALKSAKQAPLTYPEALLQVCMHVKKKLTPYAEDGTIDGEGEELLNYANRVLGTLGAN